YSWAPSGGTAATASGLSAGTYTVTVTDANSCTATQSFTITEPTALVVTPASQTNVSCNSGSNGSATVTVSGGTAGYTYSWAPPGGT
ncbi:adhesin, partial [Flavobacterium sp. LMO6]|uniref:SprB repeat-containing protein n=3 Tax=unclassified Flavobacterium TaxID=196869 RepID=UPI00132BB3DA